MRGANWDEQLLAEHREFIAEEEARAAFDTIVQAAEQLPGYDCAPTWHGNMRTFTFITSSQVLPTTTEANGLREPEGPEDPNWRIPGIGPRTKFEPAPGARPDVVLTMIATGSATVATVQAALDSLPAKNQEAKERHTVLGLLRWAAKKHGMSFMCVDGILSTDYRPSPTRPFEFIVNRGHLRFYVRRPAYQLVEATSLRSAFPLTEEVNGGELALNIVRYAEARRLLDLVFPTVTTSQAATFGRPYIPVGTVAASAPRDPFPVDPDVVDRGNQAHASTQDALAAFLREHGIDPRSPLAGEPKVDLGWSHDNRLWVAEVKSTTDSNEEAQLRLGLGQVLRYRHALASVSDLDVVAVLVPEREPTDPQWLALCEALGVILVWPPSFERLHERLWPASQLHGEAESAPRSVP
jgi:hypothetical protein